MLFPIGTKVRFRFTGETGQVVSLLNDGMLLVRLDSDRSLDIPTFEEDLQDATERPAVAANPYGPKQAKTPLKQAEKPPRRDIRATHPIDTPKGLQLCFEAMPARDGAITRYTAWLLNDTAADFLIDIGMYIGEEKLFHTEDFSHACSAIELGELLADDLNDHPEVDVQVQRMTTAGTDAALKLVLKIKPKSFFNRLLHVPILQMPVHQFVLFDRFDTPDADEAPKDDLKAYTKQKLGNNAAAQTNSNSRPFKLYSLEEYATFVPEIDLHIENLTEGWQRMSSADILRIQLQHCQRFLDKAIRLGVPSVFLIHGVGEGKLRDAIADALRHNPQVKKFKNQFHQKFGFGATEVWF